jgi:Tol biopolymer transport system component
MKRNKNVLIVFIIVLLIVVFYLKGTQLFNKYYGYVEETTIPEDEFLVPKLSNTEISGVVVYSSFNEENVPQIFLKDLETDETNQLTYSGYNDNPKWSPSGEKILYLSWTEENSFDIYTMDKNGNNKIPVVASPASEKMPDWSPDGEKIVYVSDEIGKSEICIIDLITNEVSILKNGTEFVATPYWSPDGKFLAFISNGGGPGRSQVFVMDIDGNNKWQVTSYDISNFDGNPVWCPDGSCILFNRFIEGVPKIMKYDIKTKETTLLLENVFSKELIEAQLERSQIRGLFTFVVGDNFYAMDLKKMEVYSLEIFALDLSLYP